MLQTITVTLDHVKLETRDSGRRCWDYVAVYDGLTIHDILIHKCIANGIQVTSTGSTVLIVFWSDSDNNSGRFLVSWNIVGSGRFSLCTIIDHT